MFYKLIEKKRNEWLASNECTIKDLLKYIEQRGMMRDAQMEAIKTYLFLKLYCKNAPLWKLFSDGVFTDEQTVKTLKATARSMEILRTTPAAVALLEYARLHNKKGQNLSNELEEDLLDDAGAIDCIKAFQDLFYGITYPDYLFSLPMGAGKTYLMAAFIYLDLSFAIKEEDNPLYAHNFMILAPSGKKTSIMPSLKNIMEFDPTWVLPEDVASEVRRIIKFEILDEDSTARGSNMVRNPNAQKINQLISSYGDELMGLVAFTNAEKVILPNSVTTLGMYAFYDSYLKEINIPESVTGIGLSAFGGMRSLDRIDAYVNPANVAIGDDALILGMPRVENYYEKIGTSICFWMTNYFGHEMDDCVLHVLPGKEESFANAWSWARFKNIVGDLTGGGSSIPGDVNGDGEVTGSDVTALYNHILFGQDTEIFNGDQNGDGEVTGSDVTAVYNIILGL